jgi:hypothetical protein
LIRKILILEDEDGVVEVVLPTIWLVDDRVGKLRTLIDHDLSAVGDEVVVKVLKADLTKNEDAGYDVYVLLGYEMADGDESAHACSSST